MAQNAGLVVCESQELSDEQLKENEVKVKYMDIPRVFIPMKTKKAFIEYQEKHHLK